VPVQPPGFTVQSSAVTDVQEIFADVLYGMAQASAPLHLQSTVGAGGAPTFTLTAGQFTEPPGPVQERLYTWPVVSFGLDHEPDGVAFDPDHPPDAVHEVEFGTFHESVVLPL
jgi:hypothetical protein